MPDLRSRRLAATIALSIAAHLAPPPDLAALSRVHHVSDRTPGRILVFHDGVSYQAVGTFPAASGSAGQDVVAFGSRSLDGPWTESELLSDVFVLGFSQHAILHPTQNLIGVVISHSDVAVSLPRGKASILWFDTETQQWQTPRSIPHDRDVRTLDVVASPTGLYLAYLDLVRREDLSIDHYALVVEDCTFAEKVSCQELAVRRDAVSTFAPKLLPLPPPQGAGPSAVTKRTASIDPRDPRLAPRGAFGVLVVGVFLFGDHIFYVPPLSLPAELGPVPSQQELARAIEALLPPNPGCPRSHKPRTTSACGSGVSWSEERSSCSA